MRLVDFDFRIWDNSDIPYLENPAFAIFTNSNRGVDFIRSWQCEV